MSRDGTRRASSTSSPGKRRQSSSPATAPRADSSKPPPAWPSTSGPTPKEPSTPSTTWSPAPTSSGSWTSPPAPTSPRPQPKMAEPRAEKRGTLRGPPSFRVMDNGRQWRRAPHEICGARPNDVVGSPQARRTYAALRTSSHNSRIRFGDIDPRPLAAARAKERLMHDPQNPSRIENSHPYKTPG